MTNIAPTSLPSPPITRKVSDEEFFQTVACNPHFPHHTMRTHNDNLRFVNWWGDQASPSIVPPFRAVAAANSGAMFGRKFSSSTDEGRDGIRWIESYLADSSRVSLRRITELCESRSAFRPCWSILSLFGQLEMGSVKRLDHSDPLLHVTR